MTQSPSSPTPTVPPRARRSLLRRLLRGALLSGLIMTVLGGLGAAAGWRWFEAEVLADLPDDLSTFRDWRPPASCIVRGADGAEIDSFYIERRFWVDLGTLPPHVSQAFIAAEDARFYQHEGVDPFGIARALLANLQGGEASQGASTLTQQLVKNLIVGKERSYRRKLREAVVAYRLENELSKDQILELYLNFIFLGAGNYGVEAAARDYFGKGAAELDPGEAALLAGLVPAPSRYQPRRSPERARWRRSLVLRRLVDAGYMTEAEAAGYELAPVFVPERAPGGPTGTGTAYVTQVRREVRRLFGDELPFIEGFSVDTAYAPEIQRVAEAAIAEATAKLTARQGHPFVHPAPLPGVERAPLAAPAEGARCFPVEVGRKGLAELIDGSGARWAISRGAEQTLAHGDAETPARPLSALARPGLRLDVCRAEGEGAVEGQVRPRTEAWVEGAAVVLDHRSGEVLALVGGNNVGLEGFVRATQARRQPGSSFKPYVYAAAMVDGLGQLDTVLDAPISLPAGNGRSWSPKNYSGGYAGALPLREAMARSLNTVAVRLAIEAGPADIARLARAMGVRSALRKDLTLALGSSELTPMDQALGYATIARMGVPTEPVYITRLVDTGGTQTLPGEGYEPGGADGPRLQLPGGPLPRALPAGVAYELADMLRGVVESGTAKALRRPGLDRAGKTGTTNDFLDAWYVGFTPEHVIAVWIGTDGTRSLGPSETGGKAALPVWLAIAEALGPVPGARLPVPDEAVLAPTPSGWRGFRRGGVPASLLPVPAVGPAPLPAFAEASERRRR